MLTSMTSSHRLFLLVLGLVALAVATSMMVSGTAALVVAGVSCVVIWLLRPLLMPPGYGAMKVRTLSILGVFALAASHNYWAGLVNQAASHAAKQPFFQQHAPWLADLHFQNEPSIAILVFVAVCVVAVNYFMMDKSIGGTHPEPLKSEFPEQSFSDDLKKFCNELQLHLVGIDQQSNWSPEYYTELEAEVEVATTIGKQVSRRIVNLQDALRRDRDTRSFLVLGDPGAGKSVALRKMAKDMLAEVPRTGRVPLYINLREWLPAGGRQQAGWTETSPPTIKELEEFVISSLKARGDLFTEEFIEKYFKKLLQHGRLFLIFDSFDEIPELLDVNEESWLIEALSELFTRFICANPAGRGIVASRNFRRPTRAFQAQKYLDIRPMSDERIIRAMDRYPRFTNTLRTSLFTDRNDLVPIVRNPFLMALLGEWIEDHGSLPQTQAEMYSHYLRKRLGRCEDRMKKHGLDVDQVLAGATDIAWFIFDSPAYGLEAPAELIGGEAGIANAPAVMAILRRARIARVTEGDTPSFAFVHRRFLEYLVTMRLLTQPAQVPIEHIPTDSRGRDAMVLYAQICDAPTAESLAKKCWGEVCLHFENPASRLRAIHCLRFLTEAFSARRTAVHSFADDMSEFISRHLVTGNDLLRAKICVEATGVLSEEQAVPVLHLAMHSGNTWLQDTAFRACRRLPRLSPTLERAAIDYLLEMPLKELWQRRDALKVTLSLSEATAGPYRVARIRILNLQLSLLAAGLAIAAWPAIAAIVYCWVAAMHVTSVVLPNLARQAKLAASSPSVVVTAEKNAASKGLMTARPEHDGPFAILSGQSQVQAFRNLFASIILLSIIAAFTSDHRYGLFTEVVSLGPTTSLIISTALCIMLLDWYVARDLGRAVVRAGLDMSYMLLLAVSLGTLGGLIYVLSLLERSGFNWVVRWGLIAGGLGIGVYFVTHTIKLAVFCYREYRIYKAIRIGARMTRADIVSALESLKWTRLRLKVVQMLAQHKTEAHGEWPAGFEFSVSNDPAVTALAKLEERWLKLDR